jgi:hypothetical protein
VPHLFASRTAASSEGDVQRPTGFDFGGPGQKGTKSPVNFAARSVSFDQRTARQTLVVASCLLKNHVYPEFLGGD